MRVVHKEVETTIEIENAHKILDYGESLRSVLDNFLSKTEKIKSSEITTNIIIHDLNDVRINYDVVKATEKMREYQESIRELDNELEQFIEEINNIKVGRSE